MAESVIEEHLDRIGEALRVRGPYRARVLDELRSHLEDAAESAEARGLTRDQASQQAIEQLGTIESVVAGVRPKATQRTRALAGVSLVGLVLAAASLRAANEFHADGGRLWSSLPYTLAWLLGWLSAALLCGPVVALLVRHRGVLGRTGTLASGALAVAAAALLAFHFSNDGSFDRGDPSTWRAIALGAGGIAVIAIGAVVQRNQLVARWPLGLGVAGAALLVTHYGLLGGRGVTAGLGLVLLATSALGYVVVFVRERPLA